MVFMMFKIEPKPSHMLGKCYYGQPNIFSTPTVIVTVLLLHDCFPLILFETEPP